MGVSSSSLSSVGLLSSSSAASSSSSSVGLLGSSSVASSVISSSGSSSLSNLRFSAIVSKSLFSSQADFLSERNRLTDDAAWKSTIRKKLEKEMENNPNLIQDIKTLYGLDFDSFVTVLGDAESFKEIFLKPNLDPKLILEEIDEELKDIESYGLSREEIAEALLRLEERKEKLSKYHMKLLLTSCVASKNSLIRNIADYWLKFGALHSAVSVNGVVLEWGRGLCGESIVCPTLDLIDLLFAIDIQDKGFWASIVNFFDRAVSYILNCLKNFGGGWIAGVILESQLDTIAKTCISYNRIRFYDFLGNNCQAFVNHLCKSTNIELKFEGELSKVLEKIKKTGECDFEFENRIFRSKFELDNYAMQIDFDALNDNNKRLLFVYRNIFDHYSKLKPDNLDYVTSQEAELFWKQKIKDFNFKAN